MRIPGLKTTRRVVRQLKSRWWGGSLILGYHSISEAATDPFFMRVSPRNFAEQLDVIRKLTTPISVSDLVQDLQKGERCQPVIALTLDDGYADNLHTALPLLEKCEIPATVFVVSGYIGQEFWWDELVRLVSTKGAFANGIRLKITNQVFEWQLGQQRELLEALYWFIRPLPELERQESMAQLRDCVGEVQIEEAQHRALTAAELNTLADNPLIEIGSHTHTHPALADLAFAEQQYEIEYSQTALAKLIGWPITGFSFPNGSYSKEVQQLLRNTSFAYACSSDQDTVLRFSQRYQLPRLWVPNLDGEAFVRWLKPWLSI